MNKECRSEKLVKRGYWAQKRKDKEKLENRFENDLELIEES